ncbi:MAG: signal peptidase I [Verrucomicrobia bacterium]|nr:signal peptidase I [Verrucomicrobiota bacterium]
MIDFFYFGKAKEERKQLHAISHFLAKKVHYGRDVLSENLLERLEQARELVREARGVFTPSAKRRSILERLEKEYGDLLRTDRHHGRKENAEVALVAIVLALGVRAYFLQPFKIPTHSMRPTLLGILNQPETAPPPSILQRVFDFAWEGKSYHRAVAPRDGQIVSVREGRLWGVIPWTTTEIIGDGWTQTVLSGLSEAREGGLRVRSGDRVQAGEVLVNFSSATGDHLFVNKFIYHFRKPKRAETFVFTTENIDGIESGLRLRGIEGSQYYIKRCVALGGDTLQVRPPELWINGAPAEAPACQRVASLKGGYPGYTLGPTYLNQPGETYRVPDHDYWAMGDNSPNSFDSRGWGAVPARNLIGLGAVVYWPFTKRWGWIQ